MNDMFNQAHRAQPGISLPFFCNGTSHGFDSRALERRASRRRMTALPNKNK